METEKPSFQDKQKQIACLTSQGLAVLMAVGDLAMLWTLWVIAAKIQHRHSPLVPPSVLWLVPAYLLGIAGLVGTVLWGRSHLTRNLLEQPGEFIRQTQISLTLGAVCFCATPFWVISGGLWAQAAPLLIGQAAVSLFFLLPHLRAQNASRFE